MCFLSIVVLPSFTTLYTGQNVQLPWATRTLLAFGDFAGDWGALVKLAGERAQWSDARRWALVQGDNLALAELAVELNERRAV